MRTVFSQFSLKMIDLVRDLVKKSIRLKMLIAWPISLFRAMKKLLLLIAGILGLSIFSFSADAQTRSNQRPDSFLTPGNYKQAARVMTSPASEANATVTAAQGIDHSLNPSASSRNYKNQANTASRQQANVQVPVRKTEPVAVQGEGRNYKRPAGTVYVPRPEKIPYEPMVNTDHDILH